MRKIEGMTIKYNICSPLHQQRNVDSDSDLGDSLEWEVWEGLNTCVDAKHRMYCQTS